MTAERRCGAVEACSDRIAVPAGVLKCPIVLAATGTARVLESRTGVLNFGRLLWALLLI